MIRVARLPAALRPVHIYAADPLAPIPCEWLGISHVDDGPPAHQETFLLYFLDGDGKIQDVLQYETLEIALDQAYSICGYSQQGWTHCDVPVLEDGSYDVEELSSAVQE